MFDALPEHLPRVVSIGRLDFNSEGLLLLTNDGALARHLELPATGWMRRYRVRAHGTITQAALDKLKEGVEIAGVRYGPIEATLDAKPEDTSARTNVWLTVGLREGKNREVRKILESLGLTVNRLIRVSFGPFQLLDIKPGEVEHVKRSVLREQLGRQAAADLGIARRRRDRPPAAQAGTAQAQGLGMRIVGGQFRGRALATPADDRTRPTSDRVREVGVQHSRARHRRTSRSMACACSTCLPAPARSGSRRCRAARPTACSWRRTRRRGAPSAATSKPSA